MIFQSENREAANLLLRAIIPEVGVGLVENGPKSVCNQGAPGCRGPRRMERMGSGSYDTKNNSMNIHESTKYHEMRK
jgi:hypothetical protein